MRRAALYRVVAISVPAFVVALAVAVVVAEVWVRLTWDERRGQPGFYEADPIRGQRLRAGYDGWFSGVPVKINQLGFRDHREYSLAKEPKTFRILVLGDSVTFGHGSVFEHTYPYLLEQQLRGWRPAVDWQVWNLGVPGYNTRQEWAYLKEVAGFFAPDLVVVGFFPNDLADNRMPPSQSAIRTAAGSAVSWIRARWHSAEWYRRIYLTAQWWVSSAGGEHPPAFLLNTDDRVVPEGAAVIDADEQDLTPFETLTDAQSSANKCPSGSRPGTEGVDNLRREAGWPHFVAAVRDLQAMHAAGAVSLVFFLNVAPPVCPDGDFFYDGGSSYVNRLFLEVMAQGTPAISAFDAFLPLRPSQMPNAGGHSLGNANLVKASVLSEYLRESVLPPLLAAQGHP